jgi:hypothetical protein
MPSEPDYTWVITRVYIAETIPLERWGIDYVPADIVGPYNANTRTANLARGSEGAPFKIYDDDGILYFSGRYWGSDESGPASEWAFAPLDDYGAPDSGAVTIKYKNPESGAWETL